MEWNAIKNVKALDAEIKRGVDSSVADGKPRFIRDGGGLQLEIKGRSVRWCFNYSWEGKQSQVPLGTYQGLSLRDAREWRTKLRDAKSAKHNPAEAFKAAKGTLAARNDNADNAERVPVGSTLHDDMIALHANRAGERKETGEAEMLRLVTKNAGKLLHVPTLSITRPAVIAELTQLWQTRRRSAEKLLAYCGMIWEFANDGADAGNPFRNLIGKKSGLPSGNSPDVTPRSSMPWPDLPAFMTRLRARPEIEARALELLLLTLSPRTAEIILARWDQFEGNVWHVPADAMKGWVARDIPLSGAAMYLLATIKREQTKASPWVFAARVHCASGRKGDDCMQALLRDELKEPYTVHGFRTSMIDWVTEKHPEYYLAAKRALDHKVGNKVDQAYFRNPLVEPRFALSALWAAYLESAIQAQQTIAA